MRSKLTAFLSVLLVLAVAVPTHAAKKAPFVSNGDSGLRVESSDLGPAKGLLDCTGAIAVMLDAVYGGTTLGAPSVVDAYGCSSFDESGPEVVYVLTLTEATNFSVNLVPAAGVDLDLAVLDSCDEDLGCLIVADFGVSTNVPLSGTFYFVVDGYNGAAGGYTLEFIDNGVPGPIDACDRIEQPLPGQEGDVLVGSFPLNGNTCGSPNSIELLDCADYTEAGFDNWYEFVLLPGASIDVTVTHASDGALWLVDACAEPFVCLDYADASFTGEPETIAYTNGTGAQQAVYVVVDSYGALSCNDFTGTVIINPPGVIANEQATFGAVKARF